MQSIVKYLNTLSTLWVPTLVVFLLYTAGGVFVTIILVICLFWVGLVDNIGFQTEGTTILKLSTFPVSIGLYGYCYTGHAVLPNIYTSMEKKSQYPLVLFARWEHFRNQHHSILSQPETYFLNRGWMHVWHSINNFMYEDHLCSSITLLFFSLEASQYVPFYMLELPYWDTWCLGNQQNHNSLSICLQIWLPPKLPSGLQYFNINAYICNKQTNLPLP